MTSAFLNIVSDGMDTLGLNYAFPRWEEDPTDPYFTGEYQESESMTEDGLQECNFILNGFTRGSWADMEAAKENIEKHFRNKIVIADNGSAVAIFYANSFIVPTNDAELKRMEIHLRIKEWKVI